MAKIKNSKQDNSQDYDELYKRFEVFKQSFITNHISIKDNKLTANVINQKFKSQGELEDFPELVENKLREAGLQFTQNAIRLSKSLAISVKLVSEPND